MGLDAYFHWVNGETGEEHRFCLFDEFRGRDILHIMRFAQCKTGFWGYSAYDVNLRRWIQEYYKEQKQELSENWFAEEEYANSVWSDCHELEALIAAVKEFIRIMEDPNRRYTLISYAEWHYYYPDADFDIMWWVKDPIAYYKILGEQLIEVLQLAIDTHGYFIMVKSY
jgi:hypothetical protein